MWRGEESGESKSETFSEKEVNEVLRDRIKVESTIVDGSKSDKLRHGRVDPCGLATGGIALSPSE